MCVKYCTTFSPIFRVMALKERFIQLAQNPRGSLNASDAFGSSFGPSQPFTWFVNASKLWICILVTKRFCRWPSVEETRFYFLRSQFVPHLLTRNIASSNGCEIAIEISEVHEEANELGMVKQVWFAMSKFLKLDFKLHENWLYFAFLNLCTNQNTLFTLYFHFSEANCL